MLKVQRLNMDSSWVIELGNTSCMVDPWLVGSEIDGFSWFNEQWHTTEPVKLEDLPQVDFILISQNYEDHCHLNTIDVLDEKIPIVATQKAYNKLKKKFPKRTISLLKDDGTTYNFGDMNLKSFHPNRKIDPVYYGVSITDASNKGAFYCPHGFTLSTKQLELVASCSFQLLITTFTKFTLPGFLGGIVNPGMDNVVDLCTQLTPTYVINTHDEVKEGKGLVGKLAKVEYADYGTINAKYKIGFKHITDYSKIEII